MSTAVLPASPPTPRYALRLFGVGAVVFLANFGLLVLQLVAGKLLAPFVGSSLETWTAVIAAFLSGIALGNYLGGRASERLPTVGRLARVLLTGVVATLWMVALPMLLDATGAHTNLGWAVRIPVLAFALCLPVATVLSLLTPLAIRFGVPDVAHTGSVAGTIFALSSLGCLLGNYLTGFVFIPEMAINNIVYAVAGLLTVTGLVALAVGGGTAATTATATAPLADGRTRPALPLPVGFAVVFLCSFAGMTLELAGFRIMATLVGVSLFTWTGVIGVMLAGTCLGNWAGGKIADRVHRRGSPDRPQVVLAGSLLAAGVLSVMVLIAYSVLNSPNSTAFAESGVIRRVLGLTFLQFFLPMALLGTISPQVIRLCVHDVATAGRTAGRIYAVSTSGAIAGTLATGFLLISTLGMTGTVLLAALLPCAAVTLLARVWKEPPCCTSGRPSPVRSWAGLCCCSGRPTGGWPSPTTTPSPSIPHGRRSGDRCRTTWPPPSGPCPARGRRCGGRSCWTGWSIPKWTCKTRRISNTVMSRCNWKRCTRRPTGPRASSGCWSSAAAGTRCPAPSALCYRRRPWTWWRSTRW